MSATALGSERGRSRFSERFERARTAASALVRGNVTFARDMAKSPLKMEQGPSLAHRASEFAYGGLAWAAGMRKNQKNAAELTAPRVARDVLPAGGLFTEDAVITRVGHEPETTYEPKHAAPAPEASHVTQQSIAEAPAPTPVQPDTFAHMADLSTPPGFK